MSSPVVCVNQFVSVVAPRMLDNGQGYETLTDGLLTLAAVWYREEEYTWLLELLAESRGRRVRTPRDTFFQCNPGFARPQQQDELAEQLAARFTEMLHT